MKPRHNAFTLIELLIVVAIIAILAAIAVPNFLEAQMRAKVTTAWADMRTISIALEAYAVDNNKYPTTSEPPGDYPDSPFNRIGGGSFAYAGRISTPIAYISSVPLDQFPKSDRGVTNDRGYLFYEYWSATIQKGMDPNSPNGGLPGPKYGPNRNIFWDVFDDSTRYLIWSYGPTRLAGPAGVPGAAWIPFGINNIYDPSNGTVSDGNLYFAGPGSQIPGGR